MMTSIFPKKLAIVSSEAMEHYETYGIQPEGYGHSQKRFAHEWALACLILI